MAGLTRVTQKIFGSTAGFEQIAEFGSLAAAAPVFSTDPAVIQSLSQWLSGWFAAVESGSSPAIEDMNALFYVITYQLAYLMTRGVPEWIATTTYNTNDIVSSGGQLFKSLVDTNLNQAVTMPTKWSLLSDVAVRTVTTTDTFGALDNTIRANTTASNFTVGLPALTSSPLGKQYTLKNVGTLGGTSFCFIQPNGSDLIDGSNSTILLNCSTTQESITVQNGGTQWDII